jgi:hypothetical protein
MVGYAEPFGFDTSAAWAASRRYRYDDVVFALPGWAEIHVTDADRQMTFESAQLFGDRVREVYMSRIARSIQLFLIIRGCSKTIRPVGQHGGVGNSRACRGSTGRNHQQLKRTVQDRLLRMALSGRLTYGRKAGRRPAE